MKKFMTRIAIGVFVASYVIFLVMVFSYDFYIDQQLMLCDLDGNGMFSSDEMTPECREYSSISTNDLGRNLAPVTGLFIALIVSFVVTIFTKIILFIRAKLKPIITGRC